MNINKLKKINENTFIDESTGDKYDELGRLIVGENVEFTIDSNIKLIEE